MNYELSVVHVSTNHFWNSFPAGCGNGEQTVCWLLVIAYAALANTRTLTTAKGRHESRWLKPRRRQKDIDFQILVSCFNFIISFSLYSKAYTFLLPANNFRQILFFYLFWLQDHALLYRQPTRPV